MEKSQRGNVLKGNNLNCFKRANSIDFSELAHGIATFFFYPKIAFNFLCISTILYMRCLCQ